MQQLGGNRRRTWNLHHRLLLSLRMTNKCLKLMKTCKHSNWLEGCKRILRGGGISKCNISKSLKKGRKKLYRNLLWKCIRDLKHRPNSPPLPFLYNRNLLKRQLNIKEWQLISTMKNRHQSHQTQESSLKSPLNPSQRHVKDHHQQLPLRMAILSPWI